MTALSDGPFFISDTEPVFALAEEEAPLGAVFSFAVGFRILDLDEAFFFIDKNNSPTNRL
jgi:hypothetical protein